MAVEAGWRAVSWKETSSMAKRGRVCVAPECGRQVTPGALVCAQHRQTALGKELGREVALLAQQVTALERAEHEGEQREAARVFRQQVMRGEYAALFSSKFHEMLQVAGEEESLKGEIGMLRVAMVRVLTEEEHPSRMAHALAKLSFALGRALKQESERGEGRSDRELADLVDTLLADLDDNQEQGRPWEVDPQRPSERLKRQMRAEGIEPGTMEALLWMEQWRADATSKLVEEGDARALRVVGLGRGVAVLGTGWEEFSDEEVDGLGG